MFNSVVSRNQGLNLTRFCIYRNLANWISTRSPCRNQTEDDNLQDLVHKLASNAQHLKVAHLKTLNVRGLRKKVDELRILLKLCRFDVFGATETHLKSEITDEEIDTEDYNLIRRDKPDTQGGGCVIYYRKSLKVIY